MWDSPEVKRGTGRGELVRLRGPDNKDKGAKRSQGPPAAEEHLAT